MTTDFPRPSLWLDSRSAPGARRIVTVNGPVWVTPGPPYWCGVASPWPERGNPHHHLTEADARRCQTLAAVAPSGHPAELA